MQTVERIRDLLSNKNPINNNSKENFHKNDKGDNDSKISDILKL
jgi:hypothetical protein